MLPEETARQNAKYIEKLSSEDITHLLLTGFATGNFPSLSINPRVDISRELLYTFQALRESKKEVFSRAVFQALVESTQPLTSPEVLVELIFLSVLIKPTGVIEHLSTLQEEGGPLTYLQATDQEAYTRVTSVISSVLAGNEKKPWTVV